MSGMGKGSKEVTKSADTEIELLKANQRSIVETLDEFKKTMFAELRSIREDLNTKARPFPFKEVLLSAAAASTIAIVFMTLANFWFDSKSQLMREELATVRRSDPSLTQYKLDETLRRLKLKFPDF